MLRKLKAKIDRNRIASYEYSEWAKCYDSQGILKLAHSLEKGMGLPVVKKGYGIEKSKKLISELEQYEKRGSDCSSYTYLEALKVLEKYIEFQHNEKVELGDVEARTKDLVERMPEATKALFTDIETGYKVVSKKKISDKLDFDLYSYLADRHSIRDYDLQQPVTDEEVQQAIHVASLAPSACNRQPCKVYYTLDSQLAKQVGEIIPGNRGYEDNIPYYAVITVDRSIFDPTEMYQWFVNGGIFTAYFVEGLYSQGIGSCIFQFPFNDYKRSNKMHQLINANINEVVCAVVSFGKYKEEFKCICAQRKSIVELSNKF